MKKVMTFTLCTVILASSIFPVYGATPKTSMEIPTLTSGTQIPNPFLECETLKEAEKIANFSITVPETLSKYPNRTISAIKKDMIQVVYTTKKGTHEVCMRKAVGSDDISGDSNDYTENKTFKYHGHTIHTKGDSGKISVTTWKTKNYTYSITSTKPQTLKTIKSLIERLY